MAPRGLPRGWVFWHPRPMSFRTQFWRLLRSRHFYLCLAPVFAILAIMGIYWHVNARGQAKLNATLERMRNMGIPLTEAELNATLPKNRHELLDDTMFSHLAEADASCQAIFATWGSDAVDPGGRHYRAIFARLGLPHPGDWSRCLSEGQNRPAGDLRLLYRSTPPHQDEKALADHLLTAVQPTRLKLQPVIDVVNSPDHPLLFQDTDAGTRARYMTFGAGRFLTFHGLLLAKSGDLDRAIREFQTVARLVSKSQQPPYRSTQSGCRLLACLNSTTPSLIGAVRDHPHHLERMEEALRPIDTLQPAIRAEEIRLGDWCGRISGQRTATTVAASRMNWRSDLLSWGEWKRKLGEWWWQIRPVGVTKADLAHDVDSLLPLLRRLPGASPYDIASFAEVEDFVFRTDPRTHVFYSGYDDHSIPAALGYDMDSLLQLRFARLSIAAELHRHRTGAYPGRIEELFSPPLASPFTGNPVRMIVAGNGRLRFEADCAGFLPDGTILFHGALPAILEYPPQR